MKKIRAVMSHRDSIYRLEDFIEIYDTCVDGKISGKRSRSAEGKKPVLVAVEPRNNKAVLLPCKSLTRFREQPFAPFHLLSLYLKYGQHVRTDGLAALNCVSKNHTHNKKVTTPDGVSMAAACPCYD